MVGLRLLPDIEERRQLRAARILENVERMAGLLPTSRVATLFLLVSSPVLLNHPERRPLQRFAHEGDDLLVVV